MDIEILKKVTQQLMTPGKGILASDESTNSANKTLAKINVEGTPETRRKYREIFIGTPNLGKYITGIILFDETVRQSDSNRILFRDILKKEQVLIGIKVDKGTRDLPYFPDEKYTQGLDNLNERAKEYVELGAKFAKWRSVIKIDTEKTLPSDECIRINAVGLAQYAAICQVNGLVPIVEPEVLYEGGHSLETAKKITKKVIKMIFHEMDAHKVELGAVILKTSMVLAGNKNKDQTPPEEVAKATVETLKESVPKNVGGVVFLSGGQTPEQAIHNLNEIAELEPLPWELTFSFLRAIEGPAEEIWQGKDSNVEKAREAFVEQLKLSTMADRGKL